MIGKPEIMVKCSVHTSEHSVLDMPGLICFPFGSRVCRDEEYDRGKRKKIRGCKYSFGGPNVFQDVATKKAKLKRKK